MKWESRISMMNEKVVIFAVAVMLSLLISSIFSPLFSMIIKDLITFPTLPAPHSSITFCRRIMWKALLSVVIFA